MRPMSSWRSLRPQVALRSSQSAIFVLKSAIRNPWSEIVVLNPQSEIRNPQFSVDQDIGQSAIIRKAYSVGDVAQLGERRTRTAEVVGSNPIVSTKIGVGRLLDLAPILVIWWIEPTTLRGMRGSVAPPEC